MFVERQNQNQTHFIFHWLSYVTIYEPINLTEAMVLGATIFISLVDVEKTF